ncbi:trypsin-like peptidase domain-containing protein [Streptomyces actuosus]|uniref:Trypsin-like peptidase domain-containing protein n=1 Tax=Streptomyces actuosus TaxID=1885 RepID=A0ABS2VNX2_STRAS|nr:trypsin-like peptidase domain-containing protein [Streptomyces actuosus]MBN0044751.1 trypsin-like peptidase domain-containing protein [Streptomyces actuosus]
MSDAAQCARGPGGGAGAAAVGRAAGGEWQARIECGGRVAGAGFLVAPDTVLTCAHVAVGNVDPLTVTFTEQPGCPTVTARVVAHGGWAGGDTDLGDLAVLRLDESVAAAPAALAPADTAYGTPPRKLVVHGYPKGFDEGTLAEYRITAPRLIKREWLQLEAWQLGGQPLASGFSGAAVVLVDTGEVVGMVTAAAAARDVHNGRMMPTQVMSRYWSGLSGLVPAAGHTAADRARLRGLVERAVRAGLDCDPARLYTAAADPFDPPPPEEGFDSLWSAALFVLCELDGPGAAHTVARFADRLQARLHAPAAAEPTAPGWAPILVELAHSGAGDDMIRVEVSAYSAGRRHPVASETVPQARLRARVQEGIEAAFHHLTPGADELITFSLPRDWLDWPVDRWESAPDDDTPLGCLYPLVVTDHARRKASTRHVLTRAWNRLDSWPGARMHRVACGDGEEPARLRLRLRRAEACLAGFAAAPAAAPTRPHFEASLTAPAPVVVWSRRGCGTTGGDAGRCAGAGGCTGKAFLDALDVAVTAVPPAELPRRVLDLREEAATGDGHWAQDIQLLWDDPRVFTDPHAGGATPARSPVG